jgi:hypothetical protein
VKQAIAKSEFDDENLEIRTNEYTKEVNVRYQVDEGQKLEMSIRLPTSYPLAEVEIVGVNRIGVDQLRWNKWLLTCKIACKVRYRRSPLILTCLEWDDRGRFNSLCE